MSTRSAADLRAVIAKVKADKAVSGQLADDIQQNHVRVLTGAPYNLSLAEVKAAYDDPQINTTRTKPPPWLAGAVKPPPWL